MLSDSISASLKIPKINSWLILPLWLFREAFFPISLSFLILSTLVFFQQLARNSEVLFSPLLDWGGFSQIIFSLIPPIVTFTLPVGIAIGEIIAISKLAADCEWVAIESSTLGKLTQWGPFTAYGFIGFILILGLNWNFAPSSIAKLKNLRSTFLATDKAANLIRPQTFISQFPNYLIRVKTVDPLSGKWSGVLILQKDKQSQEIQLLAAQTGSITPLDQGFTSFEVRLSNGIYIKNILSANDHITSAFKENTLRVVSENFRTNEISMASDSKDSAQLMSMQELWSSRSRSKAIANPSQSVIDFELEFSKRIANSLAAIYASLCAIFLTVNLRPRQSRRALLIIACFLLLVFFYASITYGQNLTLKGIVPARIAIALSCLVSFSIVALIPFILNNRWTLWLRAAWRSNAPAELNKNKTTKQVNGFLLKKRPYSEQHVPSLNLGHYLVLSEFFNFFIIAIILLTSTILLFTLLDIAPAVAKNHINLGYAFGYLAKLSPQIIYYMLPFSVLIAVVSSATALARTGQLTLLIYYAISPLRLVLPVILFVSTVGFFVFHLSDSILPYTNRDQDNRYRIIKGRSLEDTTVAFDWQWISDEESSLIYGYRISTQNNEKVLNALLIRLANSNYYLSELTYLNEIRLSELTQVKNSSSTFQYLIGNDGLAKIQALDNFELPVALSKPDLIYNKTYHEASKMSVNELKRYINRVEKTGLPTIGLRMELAQKYSFPFACITLMFLALPICLIQIQRQHQSRFSAILISTTLALIFWAILSIFEAAGKRGTIPIDLAAWSPHALFLALAATIQLKLHYQ